MSTQLDFISALREEEDDHGMTTMEPVSQADWSIPSEPAVVDLKILYFTPESLPTSHHDVTIYKTQLFGKPSAGADRGPRSLLLSDEAATASIDRSRLEAVLGQLHFDIQPQTRGWSVGGNVESITTQHFNYGLNERLFVEYLEHQVLLRLNRGARLGVGSSSQAPPSASVYLTNFPIEWTQQDIGALFSPFGPLESVALMTGRRGYGTRGAAFVNFGRVEDASRAIEGLNGMVTGEFRLSVSYAKSKTRL